MSKNELDKSIEELEAEVIAELEEANLEEAKMKQPNDSGGKPNQPIQLTENAKIWGLPW